MKFWAARKHSLTALLLFSSNLFLIEPAHAALYAFTSHTFTPCGTTGTAGPSQASCRSTYSTTWDENNSYFTVTGGIQYWVVPATGNYTIEAGGAKGGNGNSGTGGAGAKITGTFNLTEGETVRILVGQSGGDHPTLAGGTNATGGGGGGTFVIRTPYNTNASILLIAGGGGGSGSSSGGGAGQITTSGQAGRDTSPGAGGINGGGGGGATNGAAGTATTDGGTGFSCSYGSGGGGFFTNGGANCSGAAPVIRGSSFQSGGAGGPSDSVRSGTALNFGGFGGGAGSGHRSPGGGGYSGGGGDGGAIGGGGGGSYNAGTSQTNLSGANAATGYVIITALIPETSAFNSLALAGSATTATFRTVVVITANVTVASRVTFFINGKVLPSCKNKLATGSASSFSATCSWRPSNRGSVSLSATSTPTGAGITGATATPVSIMVGRRTGSRGA